MCSKNLPIEFDETGKARLREGLADPFAVAAPPRLREWSIDPMTRVAGALAVHTVLDLENRRVVEAHARAMLFRGYEVILQALAPKSRPPGSLGRQCVVAGCRRSRT